MFYLVMKILDVPPPLYQSTQVKHYSSDVFTRNCNWKNEKVFVIIYSILVALFSVINGNMYVYVRIKQKSTKSMFSTSFTSFCLSIDKFFNKQKQ